MEIQKEIVNEIVRNGYARKGKTKVWEINDRKFLYLSGKQAQGFLKLRNFKPYVMQVVDREIALIRAYADTIKKEIGNEPFNLIDVYCGDGKKACTLISALGDDVKIRYCPVNVNHELVDLALKNVKSDGFKNVVAYKGGRCECNGRNLGRLMKNLKDSKFNRNVVLLLGSVLGSYEINDYLFEVSNCLKKDDYLLIGNGVRKGKRFVGVETYRDKVWDDWFGGIMEELGFKREEIKYNARITKSRIEGYYELMKEKQFKVDGKNLRIKEGDEIIVAILYKYYAKELDKFCRMYFSDVKVTLDQDEEYALVLCKK